MPRSLALNTPLLLAALCASGCGAQADSSYHGEPLATISGAVQSNGTAPIPASIDAALVWAQVEFDPGANLLQSLKWTAETTPVTGQFPAKFTLDVYQPPPAEALIACTSSPSHLAVAFIVAADASFDLAHVDPRAAVVGKADRFLLVYLDTDEPPGWSCLPNMGLTFQGTRGYHLLEVVPNSEAPHAGGVVYPAFLEAPAGLATDVAVTIGLTKLPSGK